MIDYYLHKKCRLVSKQEIRCKGCIWRDKEYEQCIFAVHFPREVSSKEFINRMNAVDKEQQAKLSEPWRRFVL